MITNKVSRPYSSTYSFAELLIIFLAIRAAIDLVAIGAGVYEAMLLSGNLSDETQLSTNDEIQRITGILQFVAYLFTGGVFLVWFYRAHRNLRALEVRWGKYSSPWNILLFFVPFVHLYYGYDMVKELWKQSSPDRGFSDDFWKQHRSALKQYRSKTVLIGWWWGFTIASTAVARAAFNASLHSNSLNDYSKGTGMFMISAALDIFASVLLILIVKNIDERQAERHRRLELKTAEANRDVSMPALTDLYRTSISTPISE